MRFQRCVEQFGDDIRHERSRRLCGRAGGFVEFHENTLTLLADTAERPEEIDIKAAEEAHRRAEEAMKARVSMDDEEYARVAAALEKEFARLKVARKHASKSRVSLGEE